MEEKQIESFIRNFERHMFWEKFRKGTIIVMLQEISFILALSFCGFLILLAIVKRFDKLNDFETIYLIIFGSYAFLNTELFEKETIGIINVPEFKKYLEENKLYGMEIDSRIVNEFLEKEKVGSIERLN